MEAINLSPTASRDDVQAPLAKPHRQPMNANASLVPAIRTALVKDIRLYEFLASHAGALRRGQPRALHYLARRCMHWRELEPREGEVCKHLGCAMAARLERVAPTMAREEAAVYGILVELAYAYLAGTLPIADLERAVSLIDALGFNLFTPELYGLTTETGRRSRVDRFQPSLSLLKGIGQGADQQPGDPSLLDHAVRLIESWAGEAVHWGGTVKNEA
jgi:3-dehydroquinate synthase